MRPALGTFKHEAVTIDPVRHHVYLTEDEPDGCFYRFVPDALGAHGFADLSAGRLEVAVVENGAVTWRPVPDPRFQKSTPTRFQVREATRFNGGEGIWWHDGVVYLTTKGDNRVHAFDTRSATMSVLYDAARQKKPLLYGVDNVTVSASGDVLVAEDGGRMKIVAILPSGELKELMQLVGHADSEITGAGVRSLRHAALLQLAARAARRHDLRDRRAVSRRGVSACSATVESFARVRTPTGA